MDSIDVVVGAGALACLALTLAVLRVASMVAMRPAVDLAGAAPIRARLVGPDIVSELILEAGTFRGTPSAALFVSPGCSLCRPIVEALASLSAEQHVPVTTVIDGDWHSSELYAIRNGVPGPVLSGSPSDHFSTFRISIVPHVVLFDPEGHEVARWVPTDRDEFMTKLMRGSQG